MIQKHRLSLALRRKIYKKTHQFNCNGKCFVNLLTWQKCLKNVWETAEEPLTLQEHLFSHFSIAGDDSF